MPGTTRRLRNQLDPGVVAVGSGEFGIACDQSSVEGFREGYICGVIGGEVVTQLPNSAEIRIVRMPDARRTGQIGQRFFGTAHGDGSGPDVPPECVRHLDIEQVWRVQCLGT